MNSGPTPPRPDDEARDPLLTALQQRLRDYGQAPPPGAWAAIRQQLPPAPPRPWWRRSRRLLPVLALLLGLVAVGTLAVYRMQQQHNGQVIGDNEQKLSSASDKILAANTPARKSRPKVAGARLSPTAAATTPSSNAPPYPSISAAATTRNTQATARAQQQLAGIARHSKATANSSPNRRNASIAARRQATSATDSTAKADSHPLEAGSTLPAPFSKHPTYTKNLAAKHFIGRTQRASHRTSGRVQVTASAASSSSQPLLAAASDASTRLGYLRSAKTTKAHRRTTRVPSSTERLHATTATKQTLRARSTQNELALANAELAARSKQPDTFDSLALKPVALGLPLSWAGPTLVARSDSFQHMPQARRWSLLVLAGPTLSYRTLGAAPTLAAQHPDFARLERPALGFGAQVQVRRVLSGRWALALGLGYHEYATRLALSIVDTSSRNPRSVHQRDAYRVLTLPVQFSYTLGVPRQRVAWALLFGAEPNWYQGGRSTEGSGCGCQQQSYPLDSARTSPYRPLTLALSLGLDLRYRLGGSASRWQWVVQPTARYIITPFVRSEAVGFTRRQPWSLGLLTGISWDIR